MSGLSRYVGACLCAVAVAVGCSTALFGQEPAPTALSGRVVDADGRPVPGSMVAVHRVSEAGGAEVARTTTGEDGRFRLPLETTPGGIYFAATRHEGALYVGAPFRSLLDAPSDYVIEVGGDAALAVGPATSASAPAGGPPASPRTGPNGWLLLIVLGLAGATIVLLPTLTRRRGAFAVRTLLRDLAELEERQDHAEPGAADRRADRDAIRARILELTRSAS